MQLLHRLLLWFLLHSFAVLLVVGIALRGGLVWLFWFFSWFFWCFVVVGKGGGRMQPCAHRSVRVVYVSMYVCMYECMNV